jgi:hypothetical protein
LLSLRSCGESLRAVGSFSLMAAASCCSVDTLDSMTYLIAIWILVVAAYQVDVLGNSLIFKFKYIPTPYIWMKNWVRSGLSSPHPQASLDHLTCKGVFGSIISDRCSDRHYSKNNLTPSFLSGVICRRIETTFEMIIHASRGLKPEGADGRRSSLNQIHVDWVDLPRRVHSLLYSLL